MSVPPEGGAREIAPPSVRPTLPEEPTIRRVAPPPRPYKLTPAELRVAHLDPWDDATIARFQARTGRLRRLGFGEQDAEDLAERLHFRDVHADYRHLCLECRHYRPRRCANFRAAGLLSSEVGRELATMFQHCAGFAPTEGVT